MLPVMEKRYFVFQQGKVVYKKDDRVPLPVIEKEFRYFFSGGTEAMTPLGQSADADAAVALAADFEIPSAFGTTTLRSLVGSLEDAHFSLWGRAAHILQWAARHMFCGSCGGPTESHSLDLARFCGHCDISYYPATAPCIIVLIHRGPEVLLARSPRFPKRIFSTLAGFIEPGESAEEAVHREVEEEVGVQIAAPRYFASQPWPFPGQLMLGFYAEYLSGDIEVDGIEIVEAGWFRPSELPDIPIAATIAGTLIRNYLREQGHAYPRNRL